MTPSQPPTEQGALARREARFAWSMLLPTILAVAVVVALPLIAIFWISVKPVGLADLRPPSVVVREALRLRNDTATLDYRVNNSSQDVTITGAGFSDMLPPSVAVAGELPEFCDLSGRLLNCEFGEIPGRFRERLRIAVTIDGDAEAAEAAAEGSPPAVRGEADYVLTNLTFTGENFARIFNAAEFWDVLWATLFYTVVGTVGALVHASRRKFPRQGRAARVVPVSIRRAGHSRCLYVGDFV